MTEEEKQINKAIKAAQRTMKLNDRAVKVRYFKRYTPKRKNREQVR